MTGLSAFTLGLRADEGAPPLPILPKVSTGIADLPTGAHRRMNEERRDILKPSPLGARRGGAKHRKNSPQVTVFSQSGEATVLRAGRWIAEALAKARRMRGRAITNET